MKGLAIIFLLVSVIECIFIIWLFRKNKKQNENKISTKSIRDAFNKFDYKTENISETNLEDNFRIFKLKIQNDEYKRAEFRVYEKFKTLLNELWRLKKEEKNELASNLLILIQNTLSLEYEDEHITKYNLDVENKYQLVSEANENDNLLIIMPVLLINGKIIITGKAKRI